MTGVAPEWAETVFPVVQLTPVRDRPWSAVWRVDGPDGLWWLKENRAATTYETRVLELLASTRPDLVPAVRTHPSRPWALVADAGTSVRELAAGAPLETVVDFWCGLLARYGELQRALPVADVLAAGVPDLSAGRSVEAYETLLAEPGWLAPERSGLDTDELAAVRGCGPALARVAEQVAGLRTSALQHDDLHGDNVFATGLDAVAGARIIDWGDASLSHPFGTLQVTLDVLARELGLDRDDAPLRRVRDAYLEGWATAGESTAALREELDLVLRLAPLVRAASWARALGAPSDDPRWADAMGHYLLRLAQGLAALR